MNLHALALALCLLASMTLLAGGLSLLRWQERRDS